MAIAMLTKSLVPEDTKTLLLSFAPVAYPEAHILWNAPRPLPGEYLEGPFIHGICYSHFDPSDRPCINARCPAAAL